jgi:hypothetical protein
MALLAMMILQLLRGVNRLFRLYSVSVDAIKPGCETLLTLRN